MSQAVLSQEILVFISHDSRDAIIAEAFSRLLSDLSLGMWHTFRSSDSTREQGIEYGREWYPELKSKLEQASDVVCLLTSYSINKPWVFFEAGAAMWSGKQIYGLAIDIDTQTASQGPFSQIQICNYSEDSIGRLVFQLASKLPGARPDRCIIQSHVRKFIADISARSDANKKSDLYENVENLINDLPYDNFSGGKDSAQRRKDFIFKLFMDSPFDFFSKFFESADKHFREAISQSGKILQVREIVDYSTEKLVDSLTQLGIPLTASIQVPIHIIGFLKGILDEKHDGEVVTTSDIRMAVLKCLELLQGHGQFTQDQIDFWRSAYIRRYGNPENQFVKVIDYGEEKDLNFDFITYKLLPHILARVLSVPRDSDPVALCAPLFSRQRLGEMASEIIHTVNSLNLYSISYQTLLHLVTDLALEPPHPWLVSKATISRTTEYNYERMFFHLQKINSSIEIFNQLILAHAYQEYFRHAAGFILAKYGFFLGVGSRYGIIELKRILGLRINNPGLWAVSRINNLSNDLERAGFSLDSLVSATARVEGVLRSPSSDGSHIGRLNAVRVSFHDMVLALKSS